MSGIFDWISGVLQALVYYSTIWPLEMMMWGLVWFISVGLTDPAVGTFITLTLYFGRNR